ncbi:MAG: tetraacyldisaccharide 4'-kinase [Alphaproteobacteria bacterium]|nr:tetraacyldisaccharide 4'-kinase [Alphaproteobacteria bacterium]MDE6570615.1 tetraacyldisaccharide 4'-kinase [Alphaproteobacteria bacterium]
MKTPWWFTRKTPLAFLLVPVSWVYYGLGRVVYGFRRMGQITSRRPIICVGNILAGGVGKTPIVREIARFLDAPVVMRGYKKTAQTGNIGDEATMLSAARLQVHTGDRKSNVILLNRQKASGPIVMDDGFQNPKIKKNISILVFDEKIGLGNGFLLPAGPLREGRSALQRADAVIIIRGAPAKKNLIIPDGIPVFYATNKTVNPYAAGTAIAAFAGIGYPKKFFDAVGAVRTKSFPDHYQYTDADVEKLYAWAARRGAKLLTTEKDWVRLPAAAQRQIPFAPLETTIDDDFYIWLKEKLNADI